MDEKPIMIDAFDLSPSALRVAYLFDRLHIPGSLPELLRMIAAAKETRD